MAISGIAWRLTAGQEASSCGAVFGLGRSLDDAAEANRRFVPRLPPSYGRPHHPYAGRSEKENVLHVKLNHNRNNVIIINRVCFFSSCSDDVSGIRVQSSAAVLSGVHAGVSTEAVAVGPTNKYATRHGFAAAHVPVTTRHTDQVSPPHAIMMMMIMTMNPYQMILSLIHTVIL